MFVKKFDLSKKILKIVVHQSNFQNVKTLLFRQIFFEVFFFTSLKYFLLGAGEIITCEMFQICKTIFGRL